MQDNGIIWIDGSQVKRLDEITVCFIFIFCKLILRRGDDICIKVLIIIINYNPGQVVRKGSFFFGFV